jgi:regulator of protease activity HflC (stomatin/prohibitin superfamily)
MNENIEPLPEPTPEPIPEPTPVPVPASPPRRSRVRRFAGGMTTVPPISWLRHLTRLRPSQPFLLLLFLLVVGVSLALTVRKYCLHHVPSGHMMILVAKFGEQLPEGQVLAGPGQKGIRETVYGEGWHFVWPVLYETEIKKNFVIPGARAVDGQLQPAQVGIVKALGGTPLPAGEFLASRGQQGIWREVLLPGSYRLNPYGYEVKLVDMVEVQQGYVGVKRRKLGRDAASEFAQSPLEKGIIRDEILQPGRYPINTEEYEIIPCDVGIYQTTYHYTTDEKNNTALVFDASDSNRIQLDCTIEWELKPEFWPIWVAKFRNLERIEATVIKLNVKNISRNKGQDYGAEDFLDGVKRERFQEDFTKELELTCKQDSVVVRHAFIRNIIIPDTFLKPKRDEQLAKEKAITQKEQTLTAETQNEVIKAERTIQFEVAKVEATTAKLVAAKEAEAENLALVTNAALERMKDESSAKQSILDAQRKELLGKAEAESKTIVNTAKSGLFKMQMDTFKGDSDSFLRYTVAQKLNPNLRLRLFQSGPGTFWTNVGDKAMNLFVPAPTGGK